MGAARRPLGLAMWASGPRLGRYSVGHHHGEWRYVHLVADVMGAGLPSIRRNGGVPLSWPYRLPSAMDIPYPTVMHVWIVGPESWRLLCSGPSVRRV